MLFSDSMGTMLRPCLAFAVLVAACGARSSTSTIPCEENAGVHSALWTEPPGDPTAVEPLAIRLLEAWTLHDELSRPPCPDCEDERDPDSDLEYAEGIGDLIGSAMGYALLAGVDATALVRLTRDINLALGAGAFFQHHSEDFHAYERVAREVRQAAGRGLEALDEAFHRAVELHSEEEGDVARQVSCLGARVDASLSWSALAANLEHQGMVLSEEESHASLTYDMSGSEDEVEARRAYAEELVDELDELATLGHEAAMVASVLNDLESPLDTLAAGREELAEHDSHGWDEAVAALRRALRTCGAM